MRELIKKISFVACVVLLSCCVLVAGGPKKAGAAEKGEILIGLTLMDYNFVFFQEMLASAKKTAKELGVKITDFDGMGKPDKQLRDVEDSLAKKINALFLNPVDTGAIAPAVYAANDLGIPVVTVDVRAADGKVEAHIASDNVEIGRMGARYAAKFLEKKNGSVKGRVLVQGYPQITSMRDRVIGFKEVMAGYPDVELIETNPIDLNVVQSMALAEDQMSRYKKGEIDLYYGSNSQTAEGIMAAVENQGRVGDVYAMGVDDNDVILKAVKSGKILIGTVVQSPIDMGRLGVEYAVKCAKGYKTDKTEEVATLIQLVTTENIDEFAANKKKLLKELEPYMK